MSNGSSDSSARWGLFGIGIVLFAVFILPSFFNKDYKNEYEALQEKYDVLHENYDELQSKYEDLSANYDELDSKYSSLNDEYIHLQVKLETSEDIEGESATVFCYFDNDEDVSFSEAKSSYSIVQEFIDNIFSY